ncbi:MAG: ligase-associated DNA damage response endonuclease PdeM, partial [Cyclobacteriaceae bacterium]
WQKEKLLIVSDIHLGKAGHFRKHGLAIPQKVHLADLNRLSQLIFEYNPAEVYFLGDLFHSDLNAEWAMFEDWLDDFSTIKFTLILGNHDVLDSAIYEKSPLHVVHEAIRPPFSFTHEKFISSYYNLSGHIHPGVRLQGVARQGLSLPCFYFSASFGILPAFGDFTGIAKIATGKNDILFVIAEGQIIEIVA